MDVIYAMKLYINKMVDDAGPGIKALLMDKETISIISIVYAQSDMLQKEVYLFEAIENYVPRQESLKFVKCIVFVRPTEKNITYLIRELKHPRFSQYFINFNNIISKTDIKALAEVDEFEVVKDVQEFYADYLAINSHTFSLNVKSCYQNIRNWNPISFHRITQGIISILLSLNRCPLIRYQSSSDMAKRLAEQIRQTIAKENVLFDSNTSTESQPILLILDRKFDPITPLLNQWTYQAMLHELMTITNNRVSLANVPGVAKELKEIVLSQEQDEFYQKNLFLNYGEICSNIKCLMEDFQQKTQQQKKIETIADMKSFIETYPQFRKMSGTVTKHVTLIDEISRIVNAYSLLEVSEAEQELISTGNHSESVKRISQLISSDKIRNCDAIRLALLYAITFQNNSNCDIRSLCRLLERRNMNPGDIKIISQLMEFCGLKQRFGTKGATSSQEILTTEHVRAFTKKVIKGFKGVENIYTQHTPVIKELVEDLNRCRLRETVYPFLGSVQQRERPQEIIIFIIGGITYEESLIVYNLNRQLQGTKILLGGSMVHNSKSFLDEVRCACQYHSETTTGTIVMGGTSHHHSNNSGALASVINKIENL
ncbi:vacuolar protein sorting-associated protein 45 [Dermatophagoides farinae]|uniref:Vacuolar protein sorting-associated protein 45 n=1 Tax=Dermatophagoides farinae TaxID=6954 RepID=A0A922KYA9_DERFA|nr:vacuolar protein sorting-associated protein 45-like [Dermatophagoides farinae]KAH7643781.1 vacuolar protein sorting-associated protein-like protein [Dermatophagoides farinae]KAH9497218.1 vacuolar protein sorting-associated protein 45 [Dermatophagoides farinae]